MPWRAEYGNDAVGHQTLAGDTFDSVMPGIAYARNQLYSGHIANWQDIVSGGGPLVSNPNLGLLDPLSLPYFVLPLWLAPAFVKLLEFAVAIGGSYLFLRRVGRSRLAASLAGIIFVSSGFMVMWTNWPQTRVAAWIPALFWACERLLQLSRPRDMAPVAFVIASMLLGGFPAVTGYALYAVGIYVLMRLIVLRRDMVGSRSWRVKTGAYALSSCALGFGLAAIQLLPFVGQLGHMNLDWRRQNPRLHLPLYGLLTTIDPSANGLGVNGVSRGSPNPIELVAYVGAAAVVLATLAISVLVIKRRHEDNADRCVLGYFVVALVISILLGWIGGRLLGIVQHLPVFSNNYIGRIRSVFGFFIAVLAAYGLDFLLQLKKHRRQLLMQWTGLAHREYSVIREVRRVAGSIWFTFVWLTLLAGTFLILDKEHVMIIRLPNGAKAWSEVRSTLTLPFLLLFLAIVGVVLVIQARDRIIPTLAIMALPLLVTGQSIFFFRSVIPGDNPRDFYPVTSTHQFLAENLGYDRYDAASSVMYPPTSLYYGLRTATGHQFVDQAWVDLLRKIDPKAIRTPTFYWFSKAITPQNVGREPILDQMGVRYFVFEPGQLAGAVTAPPVHSSVTLPSRAVATCTLPGGPLRGVSFVVRAPVTAEKNADIIAHVSLQAGTTRIDSARFLAAKIPAGALVNIAVAGED
ncbi:MAG: hypothetical protein IRZ03_19135, partial [Acidobacterium ailaaui]|nr:hypothetical protein [Pseudacidobacterium ailaaui]